MTDRAWLRRAARGGSTALLLIASLAAWLPASAQQVAVPPLSGHVVDVTGSFPGDQAAALEQRLTQVEADKGSQLAVLILPTTAPEEIEAYALRVAEQWKLGRKKVDDGAILVIATTDRAVRIEVGYGLEGALNDATSKRIIEETILPRLRQQDLAGGVAAGVDAMVKVVEGEPLPAAPRAGASGDAGGSDWRQSGPVLLVVALVIGSVLRAVLGRLLGALVAGGAVAGIAWFIAGSVAIAALAGIVALVATLLGIGVGSFLPGGVFTGGGGRGGGGGGGGFSGGGGGFGGGGASGRW